MTEDKLTELVKGLSSWSAWECPTCGGVFITNYQDETPKCPCKPLLGIPMELVASKE